MYKYWHHQHVTLNDNISVIGLFNPPMSIKMVACIKQQISSYGTYSSMALFSEWGPCQHIHLGQAIVFRKGEWLSRIPQTAEIILESYLLLSFDHFIGTGVFPLVTKKFHHFRDVVGKQNLKWSANKTWGLTTSKDTPQFQDYKGESRYVKLSLF